MKKKYSQRFFNTPLFIISLFFLVALLLALFQNQIHAIVVYLPLLMLLFYNLALLLIPPKKIKNFWFQELLYDLGMIFYFWALFIFQEPLLINFPVVHLIIDIKSRYPKYQFGKRVSIFILTFMAGLFWYFYFRSGMIEIISQTLMMVLFLVLGLLVKRLIKRQRVDDLVKIKELNRKIRSKNLLLSTMSHELRTPLTMIQSAASLLIEERPGKINEIQTTFLQTINRNTTRLIELTESILTRIKIETTWLKLTTEKIDIQRVIRDVINQVDPVIQQEDKSIDFTHPKLLPSINGDYNWLSQVMINLIHNAKKNIDIGGKIFIHVKENEQFIVVSVSDNGAGVDDKNKGFVYDEFYSDHKKSSQEVAGIGMGLAIVKYVIEEHQGKIYMGSIAGLGTTFSFTLPKN